MTARTTQTSFYTYIVKLSLPFPHLPAQISEPPLLLPILYLVYTISHFPFFLFFSFPSPPPLPLTYPKPSSSSSSISLILPYPTYLSIFYPLHSPKTSVLHKGFCWLKGTDRSLTTSLTADKHPTYRCSAWCQSTGQSLSLEGRPDSRKKATYTIQPNYDSNQC